MEIAVPFIIKDLIVPVLHFAFYLPHKSWLSRKRHWEMWQQDDFCEKPSRKIDIYDVIPVWSSGLDSQAYDVTTPVQLHHWDDVTSTPLLFPSGVDFSGFPSPCRTMDVLVSLNQGKTFISGAHTITASACVREDLLFLI